VGRRGQSLARLDRRDSRVRIPNGGGGLEIGLRVQGAKKRRRREGPVLHLKSKWLTQRTK